MNEVILSVEQMLWMDVMKIELHKGNNLQGAILYANSIVDAYKTKFTQETTNEQEG